jgi:hypothetical protein
VAREAPVPAHEPRRALLVRAAEGQVPAAVVDQRRAVPVARIGLARVVGALGRAPPRIVALGTAAGIRCLQVRGLECGIFY